jgi:hypothetical protein
MILYVMSPNPLPRWSDRFAAPTPVGTPLRKVLSHRMPRERDKQALRYTGMSECAVKLGNQPGTKLSSNIPGFYANITDYSERTGSLKNGDVSQLTGVHSCVDASLEARNPRSQSKSPMKK